MKKLIVLLIIGAIGWQAYGKYVQRRESALINSEPATENVRAKNAVFSTEAPAQRTEFAQAAKAYQCDGRQHCSQMTSCEEANWFLRNCPGVKMDGDNDGLPCERGPC